MCDYKDQSAISDFDARKSSSVFLYTRSRELLLVIVVSADHLVVLPLEPPLCRYSTNPLSLSTYQRKETI